MNHIATFATEHPWLFTLAPLAVCFVFVLAIFIVSLWGQTAHGNDIGD